MARGLARLIFKTLRHVSNPFCFLIFEREERAGKNQKQNTVTFQRGAEASSSLKRNQWGAARGEDPVYAGFELELAGAERSWKQSETAARRGRLDPAMHLLCTPLKSLRAGQSSFPAVL
jgi:hypothetical protein